MGAEQWISAVSAAIFVALGGLSATRAGKTPLAAPTAVLCAVLFAYDGFELLDALSSAPIWSWLDAAAAAAVAPPTLFLVATFLGQRRRLHVPLMAASAYFCAIALGSALPILWPDAAGFPNGPLWALAMLGGIAPSFVWAGVLLRRHAREADPEERGRTLLLALALLIGVGSVSSDLLAIAGEAHTRIAAFGLVASAVFLTALALRARVVEGTLGLFAANAVALAALTGLGQLMLWAWVGHSTVLVLISGITLTLAALAALRPLANAVAEERARTAHLATLGRFSAQMAHDLKNPLAAIKGSAQFLIEERTQGRSLDAQGEFVDLILEQAERLGRVVDQYQRLGRVEVVRQDVDVAALVEEVVAAQRAAAASCASPRTNPAPFGDARAPRPGPGARRAGEPGAQRARGAGRGEGQRAREQRGRGRAAPHRRERRRARDGRAHARAGLRRLLHHQGVRQRVGPGLRGSRRAGARRQRAHPAQRGWARHARPHEPQDKLKMTARSAAADSR